MATSISIIGGGRLAINLARLWTNGEHLLVQDVFCRSLDAASRAVSLVGAGRPVAAYEDLRRADLFLISTPDRAIAAATGRLVATGRVDESCIVFHCSGAESSALLEAARSAGAATASAHPLMTFTGTPISTEDFAGTYCALEGDPRARSVLETVFMAIGAVPIALPTSQKLLYHAAAAFASNYMMTLLQVAIDIHALVGFGSDASRAMIAPLVRRSVENAIRVGPRAALTGPIVRGDRELVERQLAALLASDQAVADLYRTLAMHTARVANVPNPVRAS